MGILSARHEGRALVACVLAEADKTVQCAPIEWDNYCRIAATCLMAGGVERTMAWLRASISPSTPQLVDTALAYAKAETEARCVRGSLWPVWMGAK